MTPTPPPPALPLRERNRTRTRNAILDAAAGLLAGQPEESVTIDRIAEGAEVSRATVLNYFGGKRDIIVAIADREIDSLRALAAERTAAGASPLDTVGEVMYRLVGASFSEPVVTWRVVRTLFDDPSREDLPVRRLLGLVESLLAAAQRARELRAELDAGGCARAIVGTYFAELFVIAGGDGRGRVERSDFDSAAEQLVAGWRTPRAARRSRG